VNNIKQPIKEYLTGKRSLADLEAYLFNLEMLESPNANDVCLAISFALGMKCSKVQKNDEMYQYFLSQLTELFAEAGGKLDNSGKVNKLFGST